MIEKKMFSIKLQSLLDSRSISFDELRQSSHFLFILVFWHLFRNNFPRFMVRYDLQRKINILMKFLNSSIVFRNAATRKFFANS